MPEPLSNNSTISHYRILEKIGAGGMGEVFLAEDTRLKRRVALKLLPAGVTAETERSSRFLQEAQAASALNHPNIITVHDIGTDDGAQYIAAEFVEGKTLRELIKAGRLDAGKTLEISIQTTSALAAAHDAGIIHRDIKPENVMVRPDGYVKVLDFGLAKLTEQKPTGEEDNTLVHSNPGVIRGTVAYMSPEQSRGLQVDARTDIWSFGVMLYEMLAGRNPFTGETATDLMLSIIQKEPPDLRNIAPDLPNELYFIVSKTLCKKRDERYQNIKSVLSDLRRVKQRLDYEEIERTLSPEDSKARIQRIEHDTAIFDKDSINFSDSLSISSTTSSAETLPPNNLSSELSPMIGREAELDEINKLLNQSDTRLLTITGVGGTGKTRIAQAVAHESLNDFTDGVYFIGLSAIESFELVVPIIAQTLGVREESGKPLKEKLREYLRERKILIVLDNFEQITEAAPQIGELLSGSTNLKILVTSRVRLQLRFEHEFTLPPLGVPAGNRFDIEELKRSPAVRLFIERARAAKSNFELTKENARSIAEICRKLDGLPLAIELAAVRIKLLSPPAILSRLSNSLKLLTGGARDLPERQQTMRGAIAWSYDLLEKEEKILLNRLAVFAGGLTLDGAEAVANAGEDLEIDLFDGIASLADKSLLTQQEQADGEPRFRMLVVVREFALEQLAENGETDEIKERHSGFYASLSETAEPEFRGAKAAEWLERVEQEHDNIRSALEWSLEKKPETALRIVAAIWLFWDRRGYPAEGGSWIKQALGRNGEDADPKLRANACRGIGALSWLQGDLEAANTFCEESLRLSCEIGDRELICKALNGLGIVRLARGDIPAGRALTEESLSIARELDDKLLISNRLNTLGETARMEEEYEAARKYYEECYSIAKQESFDSEISVFALNLARVACLQEDYQSAHSYALEALKVSKEMGDKVLIATALNIFAALSVRGGEPEKAARLYGAGQVICEAIGYKLDPVDKKFDDRYESEARAAIGDEKFEAAFREGQTMRTKQAIALARETD